MDLLSFMNIVSQPHHFIQIHILIIFFNVSQTFDLQIDSKYKCVLITLLHILIHDHESWSLIDIMMPLSEFIQIHIFEIF